ncbi:hypothetical protein GSI_11166 [Ganoderma sinense ZZ0214-1]|uniref:CFEM domain-containing protein n=1 Tax=Ganoderma sinense ZZ0214-1 TaxID=1077348 RepID=A0A2G8RZ11_9APHY|nr:hypothetical protein GSI_11166 [Ganoderma sinense ZZ0214-1]
MKLALFSAPLLFALANAQFARYGVPACATPCVEQAAIQGHCGFTDIPCICTSLKNPSVLGTAVMCELGGCPETRTGGEAEGRSALVGFFEAYCQG